MPDRLLNCDLDDQYLVNWNLAYGVTPQRADALRGRPSDPNSFWNPASETALTLFILGNLDRWKQITGLNHRPRQRIENRRSEWNPAFFNAVQENEAEAVFNPVPGIDPLWLNIEQPPFNDPAVDEHFDFGRTLLLFEFEVLNRAFHSVDGEPFRALSFLPLGNRVQKWSQFDAFLLVPRREGRGTSKGLLMGIEAKLSSDCSLRTAFYKHVNQIMRNLEAGFWLTNHPQSLYREWEFRYLFVCPQTARDYRTTFYAYVLNDLAAALANYHGLLNGLLEPNIRENALIRWPDFADWAVNHTTVLLWTALSSALEAEQNGFWQHYLDNLGFGPELQTATIERLDAAGINHGA